MKIEALHQFENPEYAHEWSQKFAPSGEKMNMFRDIHELILVFSSPNIHLLELGTGPGYLAEYLLNRLPGMTYTGLDFATTMLDISQERLKAHNNRIHLIKADFINEDWTLKVKERPGVIISTWTFHDLFSKENIQNVYNRCSQLILENGILLNGDFVQPTKSTYTYEGGRITPEEHVSMLSQATFTKVSIVNHYEENVQFPTTSNNYTLFMALK